MILIKFSFLALIVQMISFVAGKLDMPRFNRNGETVSSNIGDYSFWQCETSENETHCTVDDFDQQSEFIDYAEGVGLYAAINALGLIILFLSIIIYIAYVLICCKLCRSNVKVYPSGTVPPRSFGWYHFGFMAFSLTFMLILLLLSIVNGSLAFSEKSRTFADCGKGIMDIAINSASPFIDFIIDIMSSVVATLMESIRILVITVVDLDTLTQSMVDVNTTLYAIIPASTIISNLNEVLNYTNNINTLMDELILEIQEFDDNTKLFEENVLTVTDDILEIDRIYGEMSNEISRAKGSVQDMEDISDTLSGKSNPPGYLDVAVEKLELLRRETLGRLPAVNDLAAVTTGSHSLSGVIDANLNGDYTNMYTLSENLRDLSTSIVLMPDMIVVADLLSDIESEVSEMNNLCSLTIDRLNNVTTLSQSIDIAVIKQDVTDMMSTMDQFTFMGVYNITQDMKYMTYNLEDSMIQLTESIRAELVVADLLNPLYQLSDILQNVNESIISLPSQLSSIADIFGQVNATVIDSVAQINKLLNQTESSLSEISSLRSVIDTVGDVLVVAESDLNSILDVLDLSTILDDLDTVQSNLQAIDTSSIVSDLTALQSLLVFDVSDGYLNYLEDLQNQIDTYSMNTILVAMANRYLKVSKGYCSDVMATSCTTDSDCVAGTCTNKGVFRCNEAQSTPCTTDAVCGGSSDYCLTDTTLATNMRSALLKFESTTYDLTTLQYIVDLTALDVTLTAFSFDSIITALDAIDVTNPVDFSSLTSNINDAADVVGGMDLSTLTSSVESTQSVLNAIDFDSYMETFDDLGVQIDNELLPKRASVSKYISFVQTVNSSMYASDGMIYSEELLSASSLNAELDENGPSSMLKQCFRSIDHISQYYAENQDAIKTKRTNFANNTGRKVNFFDSWDANEAAGKGYLDDYGSIYYLTSVSPVLASTLNILDMQDTSIKPYSLKTDTSGNKYPDNQICVSYDCFANTFDEFNSGSIETFGSEFNKDLPVPASREDIFLGLWLPVVIAMLLGTCSLMCTAKQETSKRSVTCARTPACLMSSCLICQLPFIILITAFAFPMFMLITDVCETGSNLGSEYLISYGDNFCADKIKGEGTLDACVYTKDIPDSAGGGTFTVIIDTVGLYRGLVANDCSYSAHDPYVTLFDSLAESVRDIPNRFLDKYIPADGQIQSSKWYIREPLRNIIENATDSLGDSVANFIKAEGEEALNCEAIGAAFGHLQMYVCDDLFYSLYYYIACWYLCAWVMLCCGLPTACTTCRSLGPVPASGKSEVHATARQKFRIMSAAAILGHAKISPLPDMSNEIVKNMSDDTEILIVNKLQNEDMRVDSFRTISENGDEQIGRTVGNTSVPKDEEIGIEMHAVSKGNSNTYSDHVGLKKISYSSEDMVNLKVEGENINVEASTSNEGVTTNEDKV